jgi:hypothetical protein
MADMSTWELSASGQPPAVKRTADKFNYKHSDDALGAAGIFTSADEFRIFLQAVLQGSPRLMRSESYEPLFQEHMSEASRRSMETMLSESDWWEEELGGNIEKGTRRAWGMGGLVLGEDVPSWMQQGAVTWKGMSNLVWVSAPFCPFGLEFVSPKNHSLHVTVGGSEVRFVWISGLSSHSGGSNRGAQASEQAVPPRHLRGLRRLATAAQLGRTSFLGSQREPGGICGFATS